LQAGWFQITSGIESMTSKIDTLTQLVTALLERSAHAVTPVPAASDPQLVEAITALSKKVDDLLQHSTAAPANSVAASAPEQTAAIAALFKKVKSLLECPLIAPASAPESENLTALATQVTADSQQLTSLTARHSTATPAAPTKKPALSAATAAKSTPAAATKLAVAAAAKPATAAPTKATPATAAENVDAWNPVVSRRTKRRQQVYPPVEHRIVVKLSAAPDDAQKCTDTVLRTVIQALVGHLDVTVPPLYTAYISRSNAVIGLEDKA
jgi:hypothetical protein